MKGKTSPEPRKDWWQDFFNPLVGEVMFEPKAKAAEREVDQVLKRAKARPPLRVLDLARGTGRHARVFARRGFRVTGLDYSKPYLREARRAARDARLKIDFVHGDMGKLTPNLAAESFDLVVSLFNSFGYFGSRREDARMLKGVGRILRPGGAFVINTLNEGGVIKRLRMQLNLGSEPLPEVFMIERVSYDRKERKTDCRWTIVDTRGPKSRIVRLAFKQNVYSHGELKRLLKAAGLRVEAVWGALAGGMFNPRTDWHQTIVARKPG